MAEQRSDAWYAARAGKLTASEFGAVMAFLRDGSPSKQRTTYMRQVVFERLAGAAKHGVSSKSMAWGTDVESFARQAYEIETGLIVTAAEFIAHPRYGFIGCSPDGLVGADGGLEMKCPHDEGVHIETLLDGMSAEHRPQVQGAMFVTGRAWWDFVSYDPRQREGLRLFVQRVPRDDRYIADLAGHLLQFDAEVRAMVAALEQRAA